MRISERVVIVFNRAASSGTIIRALCTLLGLSVFLGAVVLVIVISLALDRFFHFPLLPGEPLNLVASIPLLFISQLIILWCIWHFFKARGTPVPLNPPQRLVDSGPYAYSRNPMLTGVFIALVGLGFLLQSIALTFITTPIVIFLIYLELRAVEEPELKLRLGQDYIEYQNRVPMFFPEWSRIMEKKRVNMLGFIGFLGVLGFLGMIKGMEGLYGLFGLYGCFAFFGMPRKSKG